MNDRFTVLPMCIISEEGITTVDLRLNLFQVEGYVNSVAEYVSESGLINQYDCTKVYTKSGFEYDIMMPIADFDAIFK